MLRKAQTTEEDLRRFAAFVEKKHGDEQSTRVLRTGRPALMETDQHLHILSGYVET